MWSPSLGGEDGVMRVDVGDAGGLSSDALRRLVFLPLAILCCNVMFMLLLLALTLSVYIYIWQLGYKYLCKSEDY